MENFEQILIAGRSQPPPPPVPHEPYETPEGALYIGYITKNKEYLYTQEELEMFNKLKGFYYVNNPPQFDANNVKVEAGDPYAESPAFSLREDQPAPPKDTASFGSEFVIAEVDPYRTDGVGKPSDFRNFDNNSAYRGEVAGVVKIGAKRSVSLSQIKVLDLISEGEIEGLVDRKYIFTTPKSGIGHTKVEQEFYKEVKINGKSFRNLQSIFYNKVPIVDQDGLFNFQQVEVNATNGSAQGDENGVPVVNPDEVKGITSGPLTVVRQIGERLRGPNTRIGSPSEERIIDHFSKYYKILNPNCDGVKIFIRCEAFVYRNIEGARFEPVEKGKGFGDQVPISVNFSASFRKIFANQKPGNYSLPFKFNITAKLTTGFIYEFRMPFQKNNSDLRNNDFLGYEIKITRLTPDSFRSNEQSKTSIDAIAEIYHQKFTYPNSAIVFSKFNAEYFTQIPDRLYDVRLLKVKVPSNYDPILKKYDGDWDGTFKEKKLWTDNPAWCYYDLLTNKRYGLGDYISEDDVDKWTIYELSKYCDEIVSDGEGGFEPRYVCNVRITESTDSYNALQNFSSIFKGFTYYMGGAIQCTFDAKRDPIYTFTNANVKDGSFSYQGSAAQGRGNAFLIRYNDENNLFEPAIEYIEDAAAIKRNGYIRKDINAFGCTKKSYARRYGQWAMETENTELETVTFAAGLEGMLLRPGDVINVSDRNRYAKRLGGKTFEIINSESSASVILDSVVPLSGNTTYNFTLVTPTYNFDSTIITSRIASTGNNIFVSSGESGGLSSHFASGIRKPHLQSKTFAVNNTSIVTGFDGTERTKIIFNSKFDQTDHTVSGINPFFISSNSTGDPIDVRQYRIIAIKEENKNEFAINCLQVNVEKYDAVEEKTEFSDPIPLPDTPFLELSVEELTSANNETINAIKYEIFPPDPSTSNKQHVGYSVFVKKGSTWQASDFDEKKLINGPPSSEYLIESFAFDNQFEDPPARFYIPSSNSVYNFRVYSKNKKGFFCDVPASGTAQVSSQKDTVTFLSIDSLLPTDPTFFINGPDVLLPHPREPVDGNESAILSERFKLNIEQKNIDTSTGSVDSRAKIRVGPSYISGYGEGGKRELAILAKSPGIKWQLGLPNFEDNIVITDQADINFRISAREPSPTNFPSKFIYFEITGILNGTLGTQDGLSARINYELNKSGIVRDASSSRVNGQYSIVQNYQFPTKTQLESPDSEYYKDFVADSFSDKGPFRNYDIVVEAISKGGVTSVGYNIFNAEPIDTLSQRWGLVGDSHNQQGYDILEVRNPRSAQTIFTPNFRFEEIFQKFRINPLTNAVNFFEEKNSNLDRNYPTLKMLGANTDDDTFCITKQFLTLNGDFGMKVLRDARGFITHNEMIDYKDAIFAVFLYSSNWFNVNTIKSGAKNNFSPSLKEDNTYDFEIYTENKPIASRINPTNTDKFLTDFSHLTGNSTQYVSDVKAKIIDLRNSPFSTDNTFSFNVDVNSEKYVSLAFLDAIDIDREEINTAQDFGLAVLKNSILYNFSPAVTIPVKGKPQKESAFRAYALFRMTCETVSKSDRPQLYGAHSLFTRDQLKNNPGSQPYIQEISIGGGGKFPYQIPVFKDTTQIIYPPRGGPGQRVTTTAAQHHTNYNVGKNKQSSFYYPNNVNLEVYSFGFSKGPQVINIIDTEDNYAFEVTLILDEAIPVHNRIVMGSVNTSTRVVDNKTFSVVVPLPYLVAPHSLDSSTDPSYHEIESNPIANKITLDDFEFRKLFNIKRKDSGFGNHRDFWSQNVGYVTLVSNGEEDGEPIATAKNIIQGLGTVAGTNYLKSQTVAIPAKYYPIGNAALFPVVPQQDNAPIGSAPTTPTKSNIL